MLIKTRFHGDFSIEKENIFHFPYGLPGFGDLTDWALFPDTKKPFMILQSLADSQISFILWPAHQLPFSYQPNLEESDYQALKIDKKDDASVMVIINIPANDIKNTTVNLQAPIVLNIKEKLGAQCLTLNEELTVRHRIFSESRKK